jgi:hypothetical protein
MILDPQFSTAASGWLFDLDLDDVEEWLTAEPE